MRESLYIRLSHTGPVTWWLEGEPGQEGEGTLEQAAAVATGGQVIVMVPGVDVTLVTVQVPTRNRGRMAAVVPYLLEERLAADVEESHFALGERDAQGRVAVAVVSRARMDRWLASLFEAGLQAHRMIPETLLLPYQQGQWTLLVERRGITLRSGMQAGMALDAANSDFILRRAIDEAETKPTALHAWLEGGVPSKVVPADLGVPVTAETFAMPVLNLLVRQLREPAVIDLLQGSYSRREHLSKVWRPWRAAAALLLAWIVMQFGVMVFQSRQLGTEEAALREEIDGVYLQTFPDAKRVVNAKVQMEQRLSALRSGTGNEKGFLKMLAAVSGPVSGLDGVGIEHLSYKEGELNLALTIPDLQRLEQLKDKLSGELHLSVEIQSATTRADKVEARLQIKGEPS